MLNLVMTTILTQGAEDCQAWNKHFVTQGRLVMFAGGHFFVEPQGESIVKCINETISELSA
jgi:surfactin synthase thioesterase subunit